MFEAIGHVNAPILFVTLAPPFDKDGVSERMESWFWKKLYAAGILKTDVRIVYMLDEAPQGSNGKPLVGQLRSARERFDREIAASNPKVVVPMGTDAFQVMTGIKEGIFDARGYVIDESFYQKTEVSSYEQVGEYKGKSKTGAVKGDPKFKWVKSAGDSLLADRGLTVIPTFTLDHIRTEQFAVAPVFKEDLLRAKRFVGGKLKLIDEGFTYFTELSQVKNHVWGEVIAVDIETHGVDNDVIDLISFSDGKVSCSLEWSEPVRKYTQKVFALKDRYYAIHNSPFDLPRLVAQGVKISEKTILTRVFDTMFGAVVIQPDLHKSLGRVASLYLDQRPWKTSNRNMDSPWRVLAHNNPREYSAKDAFYTAWIAHSEMATMKKLGTWDLFMGQGEHPGPGQMATIPTLTQMTADGIPLNREYAVQWCPKLEKHQLRLEQLWAKFFPGINPHSPKVLRKLFHGEWGLPLQRNRDDTISTDELALISLSAFVEMQRTLPTHRGPWKTDPRCNKRTFDLLLRIREISKMLGTYVMPVFLEEKPSVHPQYLPVSKDNERGENKNSESASKGNTATGRLAANRPNIANQPKRARVLYVPEGQHCFIQADYKSAELYVQGAMAGDEKLLNDLAGDMHTLNAQRLGIVRDVAKNVTYACVPETAKALTKTGWRGPDELQVGDEIMAFDPATGLLGWEPIQKMNRYAVAPLVRMSHSRNWSVVSTPNHGWWGYKSHQPHRGKYFTVPGRFTTEELGKNHCIQTTGFFPGGEGLGPDIRPKWATDWVLAVLKMTEGERAAFLNGCIVSDGHENKKGLFSISQKDVNHREAMWLAAVLHGFRTAISPRTTDQEQWQIRLCKKPHVGGQRMVKEDVGTGPVWCPSVRSGYWLMRQGTVITITSNSQYLATPTKQSEMILKQAHIYVSPAEAYRVSEGIWAHYEKTTAYKHHLISLCDTKRFLMNPFKRPRAFHDGRSAAAVNFIPQSTVADILWCVLKPVAEMARRHGGRMYTTVYDSILIAVPQENVEAAALEMKRIMEKRFDNIRKGFFIPVELEIAGPGEPWSKVKKGSFEGGVWQPTSS